MDWANENYVRLYTRETDDDVVLSWEARAVWHEMLKRFDRSGVIAARRGRRGLAGLLRMPTDVVDRAMPELLDDGRVRELETGYFAPNFMEAQEAVKSDRQRAKESRERRRARHESANGHVTTWENPNAGVTSEPISNTNVTPRRDSNADVTIRDANVTPPREVVTLTSADPFLRSPPARAVSPNPVQSTAGDQEHPARLALQKEIWTELESARSRVARSLGVELRPLPAFDPGLRSLAMRIVEAGSLERAREDCLHVLAYREQEAIAKQETKWLSGAMYEERSWRVALAASLKEARTTPREPLTNGAKPPLSVRRSDDDMPPLMPEPKARPA